MMFFRKRAEPANSTTLEPFAPLVVPTTGKWRGNDGSWSTFYINVGDKDNNGGGQNFEVLPSTYYGVTVLPLKASWCNNDCPEDRGIGAVNGNQTEGLDVSTSSSFTSQGPYDIDLPYWWMGNQSNKPGGLYGLDLVGVGQASSNSWKAPKMYVAGTTDENFYMGLFGLAPGPTNPGGGTGTPVDSILTYFKKAKVIPSISYGYTAGAKYKKDDLGIPGSFILGGYDEARLNNDKRVSIPIVDNRNTSLVVGVQSINYRPNFNVEQQVNSITDANAKGFHATIDTTLPYLWLPKNVCDKFAEFFNLQYDNTTNFYTVGNASAAQNNQQQDAVVDFRIGSDPSGTGSNFTTITLPYAAFDLSHFNAEDDPTGGKKYFPIRRSTNGMFVLGRAFLQEAYIITDYERGNFTVAPVPDLNSLPSETIIPIYDKDYRPTLIPTGGGSKGLSGGAIAGIVIGILAVALGVAFGIFIWWKKRRARKNTPPTYKEATAAEIDTYAAGNEVKHRRISELDTQIPGAPKTPVGGFYGEGTQRKDLSPFPTISEMDSPPAELYSPPAVAATPHSEGSGPDYFTAGGKLGRRGATRESSAGSTPGTPPMFTPLAELPADDVSPIPSAKSSPKLASGSMTKRDPSATRSQSYIDEVMRRAPSPVAPPKDKSAVAETPAKKEGEAVAVADGERRPSHTRGASDSTVHSDTTVVSQPTPEELESWQHAEEQPRRPLSE